MAMTRAQGREAFRHVVCNVMDEPYDGPLAKALLNHGYEDIIDLLMLQNCDIERLTYDRDDGVTQVVSPSCMVQIEAILAFLRFHIECGTAVFSSTD